MKLKPDLTHMILEGNEFGDECCKVVCDMLIKLGTVVVLNLSKCSITDIGAESISKLVRSRMTRIKVLLLHWNKIMGRGSVHLARCIE